MTNEWETTPIPQPEGDRQKREEINKLIELFDAVQLSAPEELAHEITLNPVWNALPKEERIGILERYGLEAKPDVSDPAVQLERDRVAYDRRADEIYDRLDRQGRTDASQIDAEILRELGPRP